MPTFSIIIPTYNRAYLIGETLRSIQQQTVTDFECLLIDDGSTDDTSYVFQAFAHDPRFIMHSRPHGGVSCARQYGLEQARGDIITYIDSDDPVFSNYLEAIMQVTSQQARITYGICNSHFYVDLLDTGRNVLAQKHIVTHEQSLTLKEVIHWEKRVALGTGLFHRREPTSAHVQWDTTLPCLEDLDFLLQLAYLDAAGYHFQMIPTFEYHQRYGFDGLCSTMQYHDWRVAFQMLYDKHHQHPCLTDPSVFSSRIDKYKKYQQLYEQGEMPEPCLKYFPEYQLEPNDK